MDKGVDFLGLQNTMWQKILRIDLHKICACRNFHWHHTHSRGKSGGLLFRVNYLALDVIS